jgi:hypothetical protein
LFSKRLCENARTFGVSGADIFCANDDWHGLVSLLVDEVFEFGLDALCRFTPPGAGICKEISDNIGGGVIAK